MNFKIKKDWFVNGSWRVLQVFISSRTCFILTNTLCFCHHWIRELCRYIADSFSYPLKTSCFENSCLTSMQTGLEQNLLGTHLVSLPASESRVPPAFASDPLVRDSRERENTNSFEIIKEQCIPSSSMEKEENYPSLKLSLPDIVEIDGPSSLGNQFTADHESNFMKSVSSSVLNICLCSIFLGHKEI